MVLFISFLSPPFLRGFRDELRGAGPRGDQHHAVVSCEGTPGPRHHVEEGGRTDAALQHMPLPDGGRTVPER